MQKDTVYRCKWGKSCRIAESTDEWIDKTWQDSLIEIQP